MTSVAVLGGGIGGLSAAHELIERGFEVTVYEARNAFGGKARSMPVPRSGTGPRADLPAEHGFRFFPGFYRHLPDTMGRIPHGKGSVAEHLVEATEILLAQADGRIELKAPAELPSSINEFAAVVRFVLDFGVHVRIPPLELVWFLERLFTLLTSCDERRVEQWERLSWWEFSGAEKRSTNFQKFLADGLTRTLVAARAREMSARTGGLILCQLLFSLMRIDGHVDRVLDGPTSEVWIDPWIGYLRGRGVKLQGSHEVAGIHYNKGNITGVTVKNRGGAKRIGADHYVAALPVEKLRQLISPALRAAEPRFGALDRLITRWMNGVMFYLDRDVLLAHGHVIFIDSEWSLTAISQPQFWPGVDLGQRGNGRVRGILSVDVSDWTTPGRRTGKVAMACSPEEIRTEVWGQILDHIDDGSLDTVNVLKWFIDPAIRYPNPTEVTNLEPLLINTAGSWSDRPDAVTNIPNLFLASDFVRTYTDLATMEGANEAARRAVNGILKATGSSAPRCEIWKLAEPEGLAPLRALDRLRWRLERLFT
ncbi:MAG: FAD-dependent oxidoreductase [Mycobacterium sp.]